MSLTQTLRLDFENGTRKEVGSGQDYYLVDFDTGSPQPSTNYQTFEGVDGALDMGTTFGPRTLTATFLITARDDVDYVLLQREIWQLFFQREAYYITWSEMPGMRWLVHLKPFEYTRINLLDATITIEFNAFQGYAESVGTTQDAFTFDSALWQTGQGLIGDDFTYTFYTNKFSVYNAGGIPVDPREHELVIIIKGESEGQMRVVNHDTSDVFVYEPAFNKADEIKIDGVYPKRNGIHSGRDTNHGLISLCPGWNKVEIQGVREVYARFLFRFLYQ
ncbi:phage tail family protein [Bacillus sp. FSL W7-1360]